MPEENLPVFEDKDLTLNIVQRTIAAIFEQVNSIDDILNDQKKNRMFQSVMKYLDSLGLAINEILPAEIVDAYGAGHDLGGDLLAEAGVNEIQGDLTSRVHTEAVQQVAIDGVNDMQAAIRTAGLMFMGDITNLLETVQTEIGSGILSGASTKDITKRVQAEFLRNGMTGFITRDGRRLPLDFYAMTVTRTKVREAHTQGAANRYIENGYDLVRFPIRGFTCKVCGARERLVVSINGQTEGYPTAADIGGLPPFHPNCRHYPIPVTDPSEYPPIPFTGEDKRTAASKKMYDEEQNIRRKANEEKKQYLKMKAEADANGEPFPKIGVWRRMKRKDDQAWKDLQAKYKESVNRLPVTRQTVQDTLRDEDLINQARTQITAIREATQRPPQTAAIEAPSWSRDETALAREVRENLYKGHRISDLASDDRDWDFIEHLETEELMTNTNYFDVMDKNGLKNIFGDDVTFEGISHVFNPDPSRFKNTMTRFNINDSEKYSEAKLNFRLQDPKTGNYIASIQRNIIYIKEKDRFSVYNELLEIDSKYQGQDLATNLYFKSEILYKELAKGKPINISTLANLDVGVYAWTRHGFDFQNEDILKTFQNNLEWEIADIVKDKWKRGDYGKIDFDDNEARLIQEYYQRLGYNGIEDIKHSWQFAALDDGEVYELGGGANVKGSGHIGKKFMLDATSWKGIKKLNQGHDSETISDMYYQSKGVK